MTRHVGKPGLGGAAAAMALSLMLSGCMAAIPSVDVTRFHEANVPAQGTISVVPANPADASSLEFRSSANAVTAALRRVGFDPLDAGARGAMFKAVVLVTRETVQPGASRRSPVSVGVGGSTGSFGSGLGLGIGIDLSGKPKPVVWTQMRVQIRRTSDDVTIWEGRAETSAKENAPAAQPGIAAGKLADALFRDYPGPSGVTTTVQ